MEGQLAIELALKRVEAKLDELLKLLRPVHAHASWVDDLRDSLARWRLVPNLPRLSGVEPLEELGHENCDD